MSAGGPGDCHARRAGWRLSRGRGGVLGVRPLGAVVVAGRPGRRSPCSSTLSTARLPARPTPRAIAARASTWRSTPRSWLCSASPRRPVLGWWVLSIGACATSTWAWAAPPDARHAGPAQPFPCVVAVLQGVALTVALAPFVPLGIGDGRGRGGTGPADLARSCNRPSPPSTSRIHRRSVAPRRRHQPALSSPAVWSGSRSSRRTARARSRSAPSSASHSRVCSWSRSPRRFRPRGGGSWQ